MNLNLFSELFAKLGLMGLPLLLTSMVALAICAERVVFFWRHRPERAAVYRWLEQQREPHPGVAVDGGASPLWQLVVTYGRGVDLSEDKRRRCCEATILNWTHRARGPIKYLSVLAQVAPLLGLTGTVLGLVEAFRVLERQERMASPSLLAGGIWEALLTTVVGMAIAIPLIIIIRVFNDRIDHTLAAARQLFTDLETQANRPGKQPPQP